MVHCFRLSSLVLILVWLGVTACAAEPVVPTPTPVPATPTLVPTVVPSATPEPPTPTPMPEPTPEEPCYLQAEGYVLDTEEVWEDWDDVMNFSQTASPLQEIRDRIPRLERLREQTTRLDVPPCAAYIHAYHLAYMDKFIEGWNSYLDGDPQVVRNYIFREQDALFRQFEIGFLALKNELELVLFPTPTPKPIVAGENDIPVTLPVTLTTVSSGEGSMVEVRDVAGGNRRSCRLDVEVQVEVVEASWDREYLRIEGSECDGWVRSIHVTP